MEISRHWRLRKQRYSIVGEFCPGCDTKLFPPRDVCPVCDRRIGPFPTGNSKEFYNAHNSAIQPNGQSGS